MYTLNAAPALSRPTLSKADIQACRHIAREGSKSFYFASLILPMDVRDAALALYSFCRVSDDLVDAEGATHGTLEHLRVRIRDVYRNQPQPHIADRALCDVVMRYSIPKEIMLALIEGFEWDLQGKRYETLADVLEYSARVASTVGVMMTLMMNRRSARTLARAADLGAAMQLTNIARDVGEDARNGRLYLPRCWLAEEGIDAKAFLADPVFTPALGRVVQRLLDEADRIYQRALTGLSDLPFSCRPGIRAAGLVYAEIGAAVRANGYDSVSQRAHTTKQKKLFLLMQAYTSTVLPPPCDAAAALEEMAFLVDCAADEDDWSSKGFWDMLHIMQNNQYSADVRLTPQS